MIKLKKLIPAALVFLLSSPLFAADVKISQLPLGSAALTGGADSFPYVAAGTNITKRLTLWDLPNIPTIASTFAPKANPTFTGVVTAPSFVGALTGNASTATALAANPTDCSSNQFANAIAANGNLTCAQVAGSQLSGTVALANGGTGQTTKAPAFDALQPMTTAGDLIYGGASGTGTRLGIGSSGTLLSAGASAPAWTTATYPLTTTANQFLYSSSNNVVTGLATANTSAHVTNSSGVPALASGTTANRVLRTDGSAITFAQVAAATDISGQVPIANGGTGQATKAAGFDALSPMSTIGDIIYGGASGTGTRLAGGTTGQVLTANTSAAPTWNTTTAFVAPRSEIHLDTGNGEGSTNTTVRRYSNIRLNTGSAMTLNQSATLGDSVTINSAGVYSITAADYDSGSSQIAITVNGSALTTAPLSVTYAQGYRVGCFQGTAGTPTSCSVTINCAATDIVRVQANSATNSDQRQLFHIAQVSF